ncbi:MAG: metal-sensing transcriptional repressor [Firmicutes bacterium]|nr:metal-sensing transcriptional repressor [Bacillota bacterium]
MEKKESQQQTAAQEHMHTHADGTTHSHAHTGSHEHGAHSHTHDPEEIRAIVNRLSRSIGHLEKVKRMVENGDDCADVLIQLSAVRAALTSTGRLLLKEHLEHCIVEAMHEDDKEALAKVNKAIDQFMK